MKRTLCILFVLMLAVSLFAGCANNAPGSVAPEAPEAVEEQPAEAPAEPEAEEAAPQEAAEPETVQFTDSVGRTVELPKNLEKIAISGPLAQIAVFAIAPEMLVGVANEWDETATKYIGADYLELPLLGQLYGGKGEMNLETLLASGAQVVIDVGEPKDTVAEDLDALSEQTGIPFVHVTMTLETAPEAYRMLGTLTGKTEEAEGLAAYCEQTYARVSAIAQSVEKKNMLYCLGDSGINVIAQGSYHAEVIDMLSNNLAIVDEPSSKGTGNEVDMEQIMAWAPSVIVFAPDSIYENVAGDPLWNELDAVKSGEYYEVPFGPYNWMGFPPSVQRYLGMLWLADTLYPDAVDYDMETEAARYFEMFYHCELTHEQYAELTGALEPAA